MKHNYFLVALLLCATISFSQTRTQKSSESFNVKNDVIVEINAYQSDVVVEYWNKNEVLVESVLSVNGVTVEEAKEYFDSWNIEVLGNSSKVKIMSKPNFDQGDFNFPEMSFPEMNLNFPVIDFEPIIAYGLKFDSVSFPSPPVMPNIVIKNLKSVEWNQKAYEKDKEKYLRVFEEQMKTFEEEMEKNFEPQMKKYEEELKKWEEEFAKKYEPKMKEYEKEMEKWEKEFEEKFEPKMKAFEKEMEKWEKDFEKNIEPKLKKFEEKMVKMEKEIERKIETQHEKVMKVKKSITIKMPKNARVKVNTHEGSIKLPKGVKKA